MRTNMTRLLVVVGLLLSKTGLASSSEPVMNYYLLGGASAVGGSKGGRALSAGVVYTDCASSFCSGYAQFVTCKYMVREVDIPSV